MLRWMKPAAGIMPMDEARTRNHAEGRSPNPERSGQLEPRTRSGSSIGHHYVFKRKRLTFAGGGVYSIGGWPIRHDAGIAWRSGAAELVGGGCAPRL